MSVFSRQLYSHLSMNELQAIASESPYTKQLLHRLRFNSTQHNSSTPIIRHRPIIQPQPSLTKLPEHIVPIRTLAIHLITAAILAEIALQSITLS